MDEPKDQTPTPPEPAAPEGASGEAPMDQELAELYKQMEAEAAAANAAAPAAAAPPVAASPVELPPLEAPLKPLEPPSDAQEVNLSMILDIPVDLHVELGQTQLPIRDILRLGVGAIIELDRLAGGSADIIVNGKHIGQGDVVVINENFGVRINKLIEPEKRVESL